MRQSGAETLVTEEPYALIAHVRVCGGGDWVTIGSTRNPTASRFRRQVSLGVDMTSDVKSREQLFYVCLMFFLLSLSEEAEPVRDDG